MKNRLWYLWHILKSLAYLLPPTPSRVRRYFASGTRTKWLDLSASPWHEMPNTMDICAGITGRGDDGELFFVTATIGRCELVLRKDTYPPERLRDERMRRAMDYLDTFLSPRCRCKAGKHFRCGEHLTWAN